MCDCEKFKTIEELIILHSDLRRNLRNSKTEEEREVLILALEEIESKIVELCDVKFEIDA